MKLSISSSSVSTSRPTSFDTQRPHDPSTNAGGQEIVTSKQKLFSASITTTKTVMTRHAKSSSSDGTPTSSMSRNGSNDSEDVNAREESPSKGQLRKSYPAAAEKGKGKERRRLIKAFSSNAALPSTSTTEFADPSASFLFEAKALPPLPPFSDELALPLPEFGASRLDVPPELLSPEKQKSSRKRRSSQYILDSASSSPSSSKHAHGTARASPPDSRTKRSVGFSESRAERDLLMQSQKDKRVSAAESLRTTAMWISMLEGYLTTPSSEASGFILPNGQPVTPISPAPSSSCDPGFLGAEARSPTSTSRPSLAISAEPKIPLSASLPPSPTKLSADQSQPIRQSTVAALTAYDKPLPPSPRLLFPDVSPTKPSTKMGATTAPVRLGPYNPFEASFRKTGTDEIPLDSVPSPTFPPPAPSSEVAVSAEAAAQSALGAEKRYSAKNIRALAQPPARRASEPTIPQASGSAVTASLAGPSTAMQRTHRPPPLTLQSQAQRSLLSQSVNGTASSSSSSSEISPLSASALATAVPHRGTRSASLPGGSVPVDSDGRPVSVVAARYRRPSYYTQYPQLNNEAGKIASFNPLSSSVGRQSGHYAPSPLSPVPPTPLQTFSTAHEYASLPSPREPDSESVVLRSREASFSSSSMTGGSLSAISRASTAWTHYGLPSLEASHYHSMRRDSSSGTTFFDGERSSALFSAAGSPKSDVVFPISPKTPGTVFESPEEEKEAEQWHRRLAVLAKPDDSAGEDGRVKLVDGERSLGKGGKHERSDSSYSMEITMWGMAL